MHSTVSMAAANAQEKDCTRGRASAVVCVCGLGARALCICLWLSWFAQAAHIWHISTVCDVHAWLIPVDSRYCLWLACGRCLCKPWQQYHRADEASSALNFHCPRSPSPLRNRAQIASNIFSNTCKCCWWPSSFGKYFML